MKHYIIDGNNLIGKIKSLNNIQRKNRQQSREKLAFLLQRNFNKKKSLVSLHFDGHKNDDIIAQGINITYSENTTADEKIRKEISKSGNPRNVVLVTSDQSLMNFGRVCRCDVIRSETFAREIIKQDSGDEEQLKIAEINNAEEFKKLFGTNQLKK